MVVYMLFYYLYYFTHGGVPVNPILIVLLVVLGVLVLFVAVPLIFACSYTWPIANRIYKEKLVKDSDDKWGRVCSAPENEEHLRMWNIGLEWRKNLNCKAEEVSVTSEDGLKLYGEYLDLGADRCVIIVPGRCETLCYSYYFAEGYKDASVNFLLIDPRAHGKSEGKYSYCGIREADDVRIWAEYAVKTLGNKSVILHGICIGAASCFLAKSKDKDGVISKIVSEGCFTTFYETFRQHVIQEKKPVQPIMAQLRYIFKKNLGVDIKKQSPVSVMKDIRIPVLFLAGRQDIFSVPSETVKLYDACASSDKKLVWYDKGAHSHLRINNTAEYDREVVTFIDK